MQLFFQNGLVGEPARADFEEAGNFFYMGVNEFLRHPQHRSHFTDTQVSGHTTTYDHTPLILPLVECVNPTTKNVTILTVLYNLRRAKSMDAVLKLPLPDSCLRRERYIRYVCLIIEFLNFDTKLVIDRNNNLMVFGHSKHQLTKLLRTINAGGDLPHRLVSVH
jgi:hypothetical protein